MVNHHENDKKWIKIKIKIITDHIDTTQIDLGIDMDTNLVNIKLFSVWWCFYVLSNTWATIEAQFMTALSNAEAELKKSVSYKILTNLVCDIVFFLPVEIAVLKVQSLQII